MSTKLKAGTATSGAVIDPDTSGILELQTGSTPTTAITVDASQNVGVGTNSNLSSSKLDVRGRIRTGSGTSTGDAEIIWSNNASATTAWSASVRQDVGGTNNDLKFLRFDSSGAYQGIAMQLDSSGNLLVGTTAATPTNGASFVVSDSRGVYLNLATTATTGWSQINFINGNGTVGSIGTATTSTSYNTSSDYRLKENVAHMKNALNVVQQLKPVTYTWKADGSDGQGFIAHELAEVVPDCVTGEKDAVDDEGKPIYQGIDTSFLVATLTAAIQEQQAMIADLKARIETLEAK